MLGILKYVKLHSKIILADIEKYLLFLFNIVLKVLKKSYKNDNMYEIKKFKEYIMQKIKNESGITLIVLVITIIVLMTLTIVTINGGITSIKENQNAVLQVELQMIQQVAISEYTKAKQLGYTNSEDIPLNYVGTPIEVSELPEGIDWIADEEPPEKKYKAYYELTPDDLKKLEILNVEDTYILNYYTGEVYNKTKEKTSDGKKLYVKTTEVPNLKEDNDSFNDWVE